jgi:hypothetical protein
VTGWAFVDRAFGYLRKAESQEGYEQFLSLVAVMECLVGERGSDQATRKLTARAAAILTPRSDASEWETIFKTLSKLYDTRSSYVDGDEQKESVDFPKSLRTINFYARRALYRMIAWLDANPTLRHLEKRKILRYLDAVAAVCLVHPALFAVTPPEFPILQPISER